jgi:hypothetical protein
LARLDRSQPSDGITQRRWQQVLDDAGRFLDQWGKPAHELGWTAADLFGVHAQTLDARVDLQGSVLGAAGPIRCRDQCRDGADRG